MRDEVSAWSDLDLLVIADDDAASATDAINAAATYGDVLGMRAADGDARLEQAPLGRMILRESRIVYARPARRSRRALASARVARSEPHL